MRSDLGLNFILKLFPFSGTSYLVWAKVYMLHVGDVLSEIVCVYAFFFACYVALLLETLTHNLRNHANQADLRSYL